MNLLQKKCVPCEGGALPLSSEEVARYLAQLQTSWQTDNIKIWREFKFKDFAKAMEFVNQVAIIAESEGHHPDIHIEYNKVLIESWTHAIKGLSENDFILARKIEEMIKL